MEPIGTPSLFASTAAVRPCAGTCRMPTSVAGSRPTTFAWTLSSPEKSTSDAAPAFALRSPSTTRLFAPELSPDGPHSSPVRAGCRLAAPRRLANRIRLDHLADRRRAHLEVHVGVWLDGDGPHRSNLQLLVHAFEALLRIRDRVDRPCCDFARWIDSNRDVKVPRLGVNGDF